MLPSCGSSDIINNIRTDAVGGHINKESILLVYRKQRKLKLCNIDKQKQANVSLFRGLSLGEYIYAIVKIITSSHV